MHTSIRFLKEGWDVVGLDNMNGYYSIQLKEDRLNEIKKVASQVDSCFTMFKKDLNSNVWSELMIFKFDSIIHLAAQAGVRYSIENPRAYLESNILGFQSFRFFWISVACAGVPIANIWTISKILFGFREM